tara:strand:- start:975 stop:1088 length:114 start_codon:yes stop_codon:yes gene_type:complete
MFRATDYAKLSAFRVYKNDGNKPEMTGVTGRGNNGCT